MEVEGQGHDLDSHSPVPPSMDMLAAFVQSYQGAPACILALDQSTGTSKVTASNAAFTDSHEKQLLSHQDPSSLLSNTTLLANGVRFTVTGVPEEGSSVSDQKLDLQKTKTFVCIGRSQDKHVAGNQEGTGSNQTQVPASGTSQNEHERAEYAQTKQPKHYSTGTGSAEDWLQRWSKMVIPGTDREAFLEHIDLIRRVDWAKTPLGPMDTWSTVLLSSLGQCLASPFPVLLAWGPELTQIYNLPYSYNIAHKHPANMGKSYADAWPEVWERKSLPKAVESSSMSSREELTNL